MIVLQVLAAALGVASLCWIYSPELSAELVLAIISCLA